MLKLQNCLLLQNCLMVQNSLSIRYCDDNTSYPFEKHRNRMKNKLNKDFEYLEHLSYVIAGAQSETFPGRRGFLELEYFDKHFVKKSRKKGPVEKILAFFLLGTLQTTFWFSKKGREGLPSFPLQVARLRRVLVQCMSLGQSILWHCLEKH